MNAFRRDPTYNLPPRNPALAQIWLELVVIRVRRCPKSVSILGRGLIIRTPRHIESHPEHIWYNCYKYKIVEVKFWRVPFRGLGNGSATVICPYSNSWLGIISFYFRGRIRAGVNNGLVGSGGRARESSIDRVQSINASYVGEDAHRGDI